MIRRNLLPIGNPIAHLLQTVRDNSHWTFNEMMEYLLDALYDYDDKHSRSTLKTLNHVHYTEHQSV